MAATAPSKDDAPAPSRLRLLVQEIVRLNQILVRGRGPEGPLPLWGRIARLLARLRNRHRDHAPIVRGWFWPLLLSVAFVVGTVLLVSRWIDGFGHWVQIGFVGALLAVAGAAAQCFHHAVFRRSRYSAFYILGVGSLYVVGLGSWFMRGCFDDRVPVLAHLYHSLLLFTGAVVPETCRQIPLGLQIAELGGVIVLFATVLSVINEISSGPIARWRASLASRVILVTGLSDDTLPVIRSLTEDPDRCLVILVEPNPDHPLIHQVRRYAARVIKGEISTRTAEQRWLKGMCTSWGKRVSLRRAYLLSSDEQSNLEAAMVIREVLADLGGAYHHAHQAPTRLIVRIDRYRPAHHYAAQQVSGWRIEDQAPERLPDLRRGPRVFVSTLGRTRVIAHALAEHIANRDKPGYLFVVGESDLSRAFEDEWRLQRCSARFLLGKMTTNRSWRGDLERCVALPEPKPCTAVPSVGDLRRRCVTGERVSVVLAREPDETQRCELESLAIELKGLSVRIFVPSSGVRGLARVPMLGCLYPFGPSLGGDTVGPREPGDSTQPSPLHGVPQDSWFRAAKLTADSYTINDARSTWYEAVPTERDSNFRAAWSLLTWLAELGHTWSPSRPESYRTPSDDLLRLLIPLEHRAWMAFKYDTGWCGFDGPGNDKRRRLNWLLHPLGELGDDRREAATQGTLHNLKGLLEVFEIFGFYPIPPAEAHDHRWTLRRVGTVRVVREVEEAHTWRDSAGNILTAQPGDLLIEDVETASCLRSITAERFHATHEKTATEGQYLRVGTVTARMAFPGEVVHSQEGDQSATQDCWVLDDGKTQWLTTSADLLKRYVIEAPETS